MLLDTIFILLLSFLGVLFFIPGRDLLLLKILSLYVSGLIFILTTYLLVNFPLNTYGFQELTALNISFPSLNILFFFGLDGVSLLYIFLTSCLLFFCTFFIWSSPSAKLFLINLFFLELLLFLVFTTLDALLFYIFFEAILIPMFFIIGTWGSRERRVRAAYLLFFYTLVTSFIMLTGLLYIYQQVGSFNLECLFSHIFTSQESFWLWGAFFFSFASKIPMFPFHIWLPEAHVEAPTVGSVLLAGILLKVGVYGFIRFNLSLFSDVSLFFSPLIFLLSLIGIILASFAAIRQTDLKRIIAYSSIAHMNLVVLGLFSFNSFGVEGAVLQSINHGFVSGALFLLVGLLYDRYHSRLLGYYGGLTITMPIYAAFFLFFTMANMGFPGTSSFIGEFLLLLGAFKYSAFCGFFSGISMVLAGAYSLWLANRLLFGNLKINTVKGHRDLYLNEFLLLFPLALFVLLIGLFPVFFSKYIQVSYVCFFLY